MNELMLFLPDRMTLHADKGFLKDTKSMLQKRSNLSHLKWKVRKLFQQNDCLEILGEKGYCSGESWCNQMAIFVKLGGVGLRANEILTLHMHADFWSEIVIILKAIPSWTCNFPHT